MKLTVFQSDKGDCLLLTSADGRNILVDGGMSTSYREHVAAALGQMRRAGKKLDLVYVSHIDQDHISGVLQLMEDLLEWRVHDYQRASGNDDYPDPDRPRPPEVAELWHNGFRDQIKQNAGEIEEMLAASAAILEAGESGELREGARARRELATSIPEGLELSRRISAEQLKIPHNRAFGRKLAQVRDKARPTKRGSLALSVIGPGKQQLDDLRRCWNKWLAKNESALAQLRARMRADAERLRAGEVEAFGAALEQRAGELGDIAQVTVPNLASLMLLVEEGEKTLLLTGDGHAEHILAGLERIGKLDDRGGIHVDALKVQHHGSEHNIDAEFCRSVTADHYLFCANGEHANPDLEALRVVLDSRLGPEASRSANPGSEGRFKLWFNSGSKATPRQASKDHMKEVERLVGAAAKRSKRRMSYFFLSGHSFELSL